MIEIIKELNIEVSRPNVFQAVVAKQYDMNTRFIKATFVDSGDKIHIDHEASVKVVINALRPDGESKGFDGEVNEDGTVTVPLHSWMLELVGTVTCDISVIDTETDDNKKLTTTSFTLLVEKAAYGGDDITSDPQYDVLVQLLETCSTAGEVAEEALQKSNEALERAEGVRGIYVGSGEMPEECNVQIDPNGEVVEIDAWVVERGVEVTQDGARFSYTKWSTGEVECWGQVSKNILANVQKGSMFTTQDYLSIDMPSVFTTAVKDIALVYGTISTSASNGFVSGSWCATDAKKYHFAFYNVIQMTAEASASFRIYARTIIEEAR